jgi:hypothetical protein
MAQRPVPRGASFAYAIAEQSLDEQLGRIEALDAKAGIGRLVMWTSSMVMASAALAFAAGRFV